MNRKVLQKVIDELLKDNPSVPYVLGILETIIENLPEENIIPTKYNAIVPPVNSITTVDVPRDIPNPTSRLDEIKRMAGQ